MKTSEIKIGNRVNIGTNRENIEFVGLVIKIEYRKIFMQVMELYHCIYSGFLEDKEDIAILDLRTNVLSGDGFEINLCNSYNLFSDEEILEILSVENLRVSIRYLLTKIDNEVCAETNLKKLENIKDILGSIYL